MHLPLEETILLDKSRLYKQTLSFKGCGTPSAKRVFLAIGSIPLQKVTFLENMFPTCKYALFNSKHEHKPIS